MSDQNTVPLIQRAFQLAPECGSIMELKRKLRAEGYAQVDAHLGGKLIKTQMNGLFLPSETTRRVRF